MGSAKPKTVPTSTTQTTSASDYLLPYLKGTLANANKLYLSDPSGSAFQYNGPLQGDISSQTQQGLSGVMDVANTQGGILGQTGLNYADNLIKGNGLSDEMRGQLNPLIDIANGKDLERVNPYLQTQIDAMNQQIMDKVNGAMSANGRYGSGAHTGVLGNQIGLADANILSTNFENSLNRQMQANQSLADIYGQGLNRAGNMALNGQQITDQIYDPFTRMAGVGDYYDQRSQNLVDATRQNQQQNAMTPWDQLSRFAGIVTGSAPYTGQSTTQTGTTTRPSALQSTLGAAGTIGGLLGKLF